MFQACALTCRKCLVGAFAHLALRASALSSHFLSHHTVVDCLCAHSQHHVTDSSDRIMAQEQRRAPIHCKEYISNYRKLATKTVYLTV